MTLQTGYFGIDLPIAAAALPTTNTGLSWYNVQRRRLHKFAKQFIITGSLAVETLRSQGEADITIPDVISTREGFTQLRRDLPVMDQYFEYSGDLDYLARIKDLCLSWARTNIPDGKPINESNLEALVRVMHRRQGDFSATELADIDAWVQSLRAAKEAAAAVLFSAQMVEGEGVTRHGNWWTHHYKVLLLALRYQGDDPAISTLLAEIDDFIPRNLPYGNPAVTYPPRPDLFDAALYDMPRAATAPGETIDYIRRDALHYQLYDLMPWLEIALAEGGGRYEPVIESAWAFFFAVMLSPAKHYEFAASSDSFDGQRWSASHPEYLAPQAMFKPQFAAGLVLQYMYWRRSRAPMAYIEDDLHVALACRAVPEIASFWPQYFRWALGVGANG